MTDLITAIYYKELLGYEFIVDKFIPINKIFITEILKANIKEINKKGIIKCSSTTFNLVKELYEVSK